MQNYLNSQVSVSLICKAVTPFQNSLIPFGGHLKQLRGQNFAIFLEKKKYHTRSLCILEMQLRMLSVSAPWARSSWSLVLISQIGLVAVEAVKPIMKIKLKYRVFHVKMDKMQGGSYQNGQNKLLGLRGGGFRSFIGNFLINQIGLVTVKAVKLNNEK